MHLLHVYLIGLYNIVPNIASNVANIFNVLCAKALMDVPLLEPNDVSALISKNKEKFPHSIQFDFLFFIPIFYLKQFLNFVYFHNNASNEFQEGRKIRKK